jgi:NAD(P)-dependent dehydrogenase (short-subunit alcohol dehydrogenase family)
MALAGKHALITGSSRGIGRGIALKLAAGGVRVAVHYFQNEGAASDTLAQVRKRGSDGLVVQADVSRPEQITRMFQRVRADFGKLDIFVSNARPEVPFFFQPPLDITLEQWDTAFDSQAKAFPDPDGADPGQLRSPQPLHCHGAILGLARRLWRHRHGRRLGTEAGLRRGLHRQGHRDHDHLKNGTPLPPSQVVRTLPRGGLPGAAPPISSANVPAISAAPPAADQISFSGNTVIVPD